MSSFGAAPLLYSSEVKERNEAMEENKAPAKWWGNRVVYEMDIPSEYADKIGGKKIGMVQLRSEEEIEASERADGNRGKLVIRIPWWLLIVLAAGGVAVWKRRLISSIFGR